MGQSNVVNSFSASTLLLPAIHPEKALRSVFPVTLGPNLTIARGNLLVPSNAAVNDVQTITPPGSGTYALSGLHPITGAAFTTAALAFGASDAAVQAAIAAKIGAGATVASLAVTFAGAFAGRPVQLMTTSAGSVAHTTTGVVLGTHTLYAGSGTPTCLLKTDIATDTLGRVYYGLVTGTAYSRPDAEAYFAGAFYASEIPNLDANAISVMKAHFFAGALGVAGAIISFPI